MRRRSSTHSRARCVPAEPQLQWEFEQLDDFDEASGSHLKLGKIVFKAPNPTLIFIGNMRLDRYLREAGFDEVFVLDELLKSLDCWPEFEKAYRPGGRAPYHPRLMVGLILLGIMEARTSLRELERLACTDVRAWWLAGGLRPDHSAVGLFINRHSDVLTEEFFENLTRQILRRTRSDCRRVAGDGTVIEAVASRFSMLRQEAAEQAAAAAQAEAAAHPEDERLKARAALAEQVAETTRSRSAEREAKCRKNTEAPVNRYEPEAVVQPLKNGALRPSYKPSMLANEDRIITAHAVDPSSETAVVEQLLDQSKEVSGQKVEELLQDAGFFCATIMVLCVNQDISLLCPEGKSTAKDYLKASDKQFPKSRFSYDEERDEYRCPAGQQMKLVETYKGNDRHRGYKRYACEHCLLCALKDQCRRGDGGRRLKRYDEDEMADALREVMKHPQARSIYRKRQAMVEPVFGELRYRQGLTRFRRRGLSGARLEYAIHCAAHNVQRYLTLSARAARGGEASSGAASILFTLIFVLWQCLQRLWRRSGRSVRHRPRISCAVSRLALSYPFSPA